MTGINFIACMSTINNARISCPSNILWTENSPAREHKTPTCSALQPVFYLKINQRARKDRQGHGNILRLREKERRAEVKAQGQDLGIDTNAAGISRIANRSPESDHALGGRSACRFINPEARGIPFQASTLSESRP